MLTLIQASRTLYRPNWSSLGLRQPHRFSPRWPIHPNASHGVRIGGSTFPSHSSPSSCPILDVHSPAQTSSSVSKSWTSSAASTHRPHHNGSHRPRQPHRLLHRQLRQRHQVVLPAPPLPIRAQRHPHPLQPLYPPHRAPPILHRRPRRPHVRHRRRRARGRPGHRLGLPAAARHAAS